ncbi:unnamed protein product [Nippostrongylus brasiliensis]|uniref:AMMECR1 domain-containing protein n=1 Tax=Nippostrongylus brasiliensis TaxID=27835 RepID=A0A0N4XY41_NIPBR|nr:unnamed protein product [Nippostrongylus brasiliensis]
MAVFCFDVIAAAVNNHTDPPIPASIPNDKYPLFVTWKKGSHRRLRGCIGTFSQLHLHTGLRDYAITSAFHDSRFDPVRKEEIPYLHCGVSLLIKFESAHDYTDWTIGMHGIRIHFMDGGVRRDAVYLPEVAYEQGWNHLETINNLIEKGGYRGRIDEGLRLSLHVTRFQSSKVMISYDVSAVYNFFRKLEISNVSLVLSFADFLLTGFYCYSLQEYVRFKRTGLK